MFFETDGFSVKILSALDLSWGVRNEESDLRPYHALSFRVAGDARFFHEEDVIEVKTGDLLFVPAYYRYTLRSGSEKVLVVHFTCTEKLPDRVKKFTPQDTEYYRRSMEALYNAWTRKQTGYEHECKSIFYRIIMRMERETEERGRQDTDSRLAEVLEQIHEHFADPELSVAHLAEECRVSETYFRRLFQKKYGMSPLAYINRLKVQYALELLASRYYTVSEVSDKCGFNNVYYFSNFIKSKTGRAPSAFMDRILPQTETGEKFSKDF